MYASRKCQQDSSRRTPVGSPCSFSSTTPPGTCRSPFARVSAAEFSQIECESRAIKATGVSPAISSRDCFVGSTCGCQSPLRQPRPSSHVPGRTVLDSTRGATQNPSHILNSFAFRTIGAGIQSTYAENQNA